MFKGNIWYSFLSYQRMMYYNLDKGWKKKGTLKIAPKMVTAI